MVMATKPLLPVHQLPLYNVGRMSAEQVIAAFAARRPQLERIVGDIAAEKPQSRAQHHLIVGQRGMGKTMLLARIAAALRTTPELSSRFIPLVFAEEQYAVDRLSKFWLNCLDSLADARELAGATEAVAAIDAAVARLTSAPGPRAARDDQPLAEEAYGVFARLAAASGQRPVLLVDNLQLVFERLDDGQQHALRELLTRPGSPVLVGTSPSPPSQDYGAAFYDQFKVHYLRPLEVAEMQSLLVHLAEATQRDDVRQRILEGSGRLAVLRQLTGGNPRTTVTLFFLYAEDFSPSVFGDLEGLLDRVTPLYKARFEELAPQQQVVASAIANHWDPVTAASLVDATGLPAGTISSQLDRLEKLGVVERTDLFGESRTGYQLAERFFNIWFLMRSASRRQRREVEFLTRFLESFYEPADRRRLAHQLMGEAHFTPDRLVWCRAVAASLAEKEAAEELNRHAELAALRDAAREAHGRLREAMDFDRLAPATLAFADLRKKLESLVAAEAGVAPDDFAQLILGDRGMFTSGERERLAAREGKLNVAETRVLLETVQKARAADEQRYSAEAVQWFSRRLADGQIRASSDVEDWNRAFQQARGKEVLRLMLESLPDGIGAAISDSNVAKISAALRPDFRKLAAPAEPEQQALADRLAAFEATAWCETLVRLSRFAEAEQAYRETVARFPTSRTWQAMGRFYEERLQRFDEAEFAYRQAIACDANDGQGWLLLGVLLAERLGRLDEAETAFREAIARNPDDDWPWCLLGGVFKMQHRLDEAEKACRKSIAIDPSKYAWVFLALVLEDLGRWDEAEKAYREAIAADPQDPASWKALGQLLWVLGRLADASEALDKAQRLAPKAADILSERLFLRRDVMGEVLGARSLLDDLRALTKEEWAKTRDVHEALFAAYEQNWGLARAFLDGALSSAAESFERSTWIRASAVLLHLGYGAELLSYLREHDHVLKLRPWVEALNAHLVGDRRALLNVAPEIRASAEAMFDLVDAYLKKLPRQTRRRAVEQPQPRRAKRRK